ncbi:MAG TPA: hypothetical protein VK210_07040 [Terriglobia bacterium]|nr:hypothetical protein [Terriglobia bacterium]
MNRRELITSVLAVSAVATAFSVELNAQAPPPHINRNRCRLIRRN